MYCSECGVHLKNNPRFCANCGHAINGNNAPAGQITASPSQETPVSPGVASSSLGTKWLTFWNLFSLPVGGLVSLLVSIGTPALAIIFAPIAILQFVVAYGLVYRRLWAWQWNWGLLVLTWISGAIPLPLPSASIDVGWLLEMFVIRALFGGLFWMWPNYIYWMKRKALFS